MVDAAEICARMGGNPIWYILFALCRKTDGVLLERCRRGGEFEYVSIDSTAKHTLPLIGQVNRNKLKKLKRNQASPYADPYRAVNIVRGATGAPLLIGPMFSESVDATGVLYADKFTLNQREAVKYMALDRTNALVVSTMRKVFPSLKGCALGPMHIAMAVEVPTWERKNALSTRLQKIVAKFSPTSRGSASNGDFYDGGELLLERGEQMIRTFLPLEKISQKDSIKQLEEIDSSTGFESRSEFCTYVARLIRAYPEIASKRGRMRKTAGDLLTAACGAGDIERYLNNERIRRAISQRASEFMAVGATGSEALGAELKKWFGRIAQLHAPILKLKLRIFHMAKLSAL